VLIDHGNIEIAVRFIAKADHGHGAAPVAYECRTPLLARTESSNFSGAVDVALPAG